MYNILILAIIGMALVACQSLPVQPLTQEPVVDDVVQGGPTRFEAAFGIATWKDLDTGNVVTGNHTTTLTQPFHLELVPYSGYRFVRWEGVSGTSTTITIQPGTVLVRAILAPTGNG